MYTVTCMSEFDDPRADLDRRLGLLTNGDDSLGMALAESTDYEKTWDTRLARSRLHNLESFRVAPYG